MQLGQHFCVLEDQVLRVAVDQRVLLRLGLQ